MAELTFTPGNVSANAFADAGTPDDVVTSAAMDCDGVPDLWAGHYYIRLSGVLDIFKDGGGLGSGIARIQVSVDGAAYTTIEEISGGTQTLNIVNKLYDIGFSARATLIKLRTHAEAHVLTAISVTTSASISAAVVISDDGDVIAGV